MNQSVKASRPLVALAARMALVIGLAGAGPVLAVPCGPVYTGGVAPSVACRNGPDGDISDSAADLNSGSYFGINTWNLLDTTADGVDEDVWTFWNLSGSVNPNGTRHGLIELADGIWSQFSSLAVVLNGRGGLLDSDVKWAAYRLNPGDAWLAWSYDLVHRLGSASLYGRARTAPPPGGGGPVTVPEPQVLALLLVALGIGGFALRRVRA
jgi:hypothetical protein